jgi:predicted dienelactone hydrolase
MRSLVCGLLLAVAGISTALADPPSVHAGITRVTVQDTTPFDALIAYPTQAAEVSVNDGPFTLSASRDAPVASGGRFPVVLFSHGNGRRPGTPLVEGGLLLHLARQGFIVVAPFHPASEKSFVDRPRQVHKALEAMLADPRFSQHADANRIGMAGFSFGRRSARRSGTPVGLLPRSFRRHAGLRWHRDRWLLGQGATDAEIG